MEVPPGPLRGRTLGVGCMALREGRTKYIVHYHGSHPIFLGLKKGCHGNVNGIRTKIVLLLLIDPQIDQTVPISKLRGIRKIATLFFHYSPWYRQLLMVRDRSQMIFVMLNVILTLNLYPPLLTSH